MALVCLALLLPPPGAAREGADAGIGEAARRLILATYGGAWPDAKLAAYVEAVGRRIAGATPEAGEPWSFTVLDTPLVNAFATEGGHVFLTRGLVALANDEAELAAVLAHEAAHVVLRHPSERRARARDPGVANGPAGAALEAVARYGREQEFEADREGIRYLAAAGYDPRAAADMLARMIREETLQARLAGRTYNPNRVRFFADHPATGDRLAALRAEIAALGPATGERGAAALLAAIDGLVYGDSAVQGFLRGRQFIHPVMGFSFEFPAGYAITNSPARVAALAPDGAHFVMDVDGDPGGPLDTYLRKVWLPQIAAQAPTGVPRAIERVRINGLEAASMLVPVALAEGPALARMTVYRHRGLILRSAGVAPDMVPGRLPELKAAAWSFRPLSEAEASAARPYRIAVRTVRPGDTAGSLAAALPLPDAQEERFAVLNDLPQRPLVAGAPYKTIVE
jgi:predicted Zn-dependent protease